MLIFKIGVEVAYKHVTSLSCCLNAKYNITPPLVHVYNNIIALKRQINSHSLPLQ